MRTLLTRGRIAIAFVAVLLLLSASALTAQDPLRVTNAFIRGLPPGQTTTAAFFIISNTGRADARLIGANTSAARSAQIHEHQTHNSMMEMRLRESVTIAANSKTTFASGGLHLMLIDLIRPLRDGELVTINLRFSNRPPLPVPFKVRSVLREPASDAASVATHPAGMNANHHE